MCVYVEGFCKGCLKDSFSPVSCSKSVTLTKQISSVFEFGLILDTVSHSQNDDGTCFSVDPTKATTSRSDEIHPVFIKGAVSLLLKLYPGNSV